MTWLAIPLGVTLGLGLWTLAALVPRFGAPRLARRIAPYVAHVSGSARELVSTRPAEPGSMLAGLTAPSAAAARRAVAALFGGDDAVVRRLRQAGEPEALDRFRSRQLAAGAAGVAGGVAIAAVWARMNPVPAFALVTLIGLCGAAGLIGPDQLLQWRARRRQDRIAQELPSVLEFLTLSLSAGEGVHDAVRRVARSSNGELARELTRVVAEVNSGVALPAALLRAASALDLPAFTRAVDQLVGALERGTPLAEVLRSQAADVRAEAKRRLLESAGKKEVAMLVPLVFLILPITVLFALFPGLAALTLL